MTALPIKISPCPIKEAVFEIRFKSDIPEDAIFGIVFSQFQSDYSNASKLPILEIPDIVRKQDPNLSFMPHYKMESGDFTMQVGPKVISLINTNEYIGWGNFQQKIIDTFERLQKTNIIKEVDRIALRYLNIFSEMNVFHQSNVSVLLGENPIESPTINLATQITNSNITSDIRIISGAQAQLTNEIINGSIVDIDTSITNITIDNFSDHLEKIHNEEKHLFYKIIGLKLLENLNPEYSS